jgi:hypothetical protein
VGAVPASLAAVVRLLADLLLHWISDTGSGRIQDLRQRVAWAARTCDLSDSGPDTGRWLRDLSSLGHLELDWETGQWAAAPAVVTRLPGPDGLAVLAGARNADTEARLDALDVEVHRIPQAVAGVLDRPTAVLLQYDTAAGLRTAAESLGAHYVPCAARQLADVLPAAELGSPAAPPSRSNDTLERFNPDTLFWEPRPTDTPHAEGLYRVTSLGRPQHLYRTGEAWQHCTLPSGVFTALQRAGRTALRWRPDRGIGRSGHGQLFTDWGAPLPPLHQRALVLCSGLVPRFPEAARTAAYDHVPEGIARATARSLGQQLEVL